MSKNQVYTSLILALALMIASFGLASAAAPNPFLGAWESIDLDGSYQVLMLGGDPGDLVGVRYHDYGASVCGVDGEGEPIYQAFGMGSGSRSGDTLTVSFDLRCMAAPPYYQGTHAFEYTYDAGSDTITDWVGVVWERKSSP